MTETQMLRDALELWVVYDDAADEDRAGITPMLAYANAIDATRKALAATRDEANGGKCWNAGGLHYHKGMVVSAVAGYPAECMECGQPIATRDEFVTLPRMDDKPTATHYADASGNPIPVFRNQLIPNAITATCQINGVEVSLQSVPAYRNQTSLTHSPGAQVETAEHFHRDSPGDTCQ